MKIGPVSLASPYVVAPMAGMTDTAFRRLVKRQGGCGLVVTEMVSSEGLVRGIDRTLDYAEYTEEERPVSIQIFGGDPAKMADAAQIVESMGADIVDVNMGCPVPKIAKHHAGCSLMRQPEHAAAVTIHGRTAEQSYSGLADWDLVAAVAADLSIPVLGSGDCVEPSQIVERMKSGVSGVLVGRGVLRNPWILAQAADLAQGRLPRTVTRRERGEFLLEYIDLLLTERLDEPTGFRHVAPGSDGGTDTGTVHPRPARGHERWVINKLRALCSWYTKGFDGGAVLRVRINSAESVAQLRDIVVQFFLAECQDVAPDELLSTVR